MEVVKHTYQELFSRMLHRPRKQDESIARVKDVETFAIRLLTRRQQLKPRASSQRWKLVPKHLKQRPPVDMQEVPWNLAQLHFLFFGFVAFGDRVRESLGDEVMGGLGDGVSQSHVLWVWRADFVPG
jgi:hypothetical protein